MAGRCGGCSSQNAVGAALTGDGSCISVTGAGTGDSPAIISPIIDPDDANQLQCTPTGLFAAGSQTTDGLGIEVSGDGSNATPYTPDILLADEDYQILTVDEDDGLFGGSDIEIVGLGAYLFQSTTRPSPGDRRRWKKAVGTAVGTTGVDGKITFAIPGSFTGGIQSVV